MGARRAPALWPRLGFSVVGPLDYQVPRYEAAWLAAAAERLQEETGRYGACGALGPIRWSVSMCLHQLADTPAALKELNRYAERAPQPVRGVNVAVHYLAAKELWGSPAAFAHVAIAWSRGKEATVKDLHRRYKAAAREELEALIKLALEQPMSGTRREVLLAIDADMMHRARLPWFVPRRTPGRRGIRRDIRSPETSGRLKNRG